VSAFFPMKFLLQVYISSFVFANCAPKPKGCKVPRIAIFWLAVLVAMPAVSAAQNKDSVRSTAKRNAETLRALGEPLDRCSLGANLGAGPVVLRTQETSALKPGDKLLSLNEIAVVGKSPEDVVAILRKTPPTSTVSLSVERDGQPTSLSVTCTNSRSNFEPLLAALDFAARGKFDECVSTVSRMPYIDTSAAALKVDCASLSRNVSKTDVSAMSAQLAEMAIEDARYAPAARAGVVAQLRNMEGIITEAQGVARFQALVEATKRWPGGEALYSSLAPDWALFRRNSESALRAHLIDPDSARIEWPHGFLLGTWKPFLSKTIEGYWSCGLINARNRMGGYTGATSFVVVLDPSGYVKYSEIGESRDFDLLSASCAKSVKLLPPPPPELKTDTAALGNNGGSSLADELKKLVDLRNSGALSEAEFQAAKTKLLKGSEN